MGVLSDFERRLEGAVDGFFAKLFRSGLQPVELAKGLQRYARDAQNVSHDGVVVPNAYRFTINARDQDRFERLGVDLGSELAEVVTGTARERSWILRGPAIVRVASGSVPVGRYDLVGRVEAVESPGVKPDDPPPADVGPRRSTEQPPAQAPAGEDDGPATAVLHGPMVGPPPPATPTVRVLSGGEALTVELAGRKVAGRAATCDVTLSETTVSREHAAFVKRHSGWWVVDLGSMNGTKVNGRQVGEHELSDGDTIELGEAALEFRER